MSMTTASKRLLFLLAAATAIAAGATAAPAGADLTHNGKFVFKGHIDKGDPVNLVFTGGVQPRGYGECDNTADQPHEAKGPDCVVKLVEVAWKRGGMGERLCDGGANLVFYKEGGGTVNPESDKSLTTSFTCKKEFHMRIWTDTHHGHVTHMFAVGAIHHENRCFVPGCGHHIDMNWETVEDIAVTQLGASQEGEPSQCTQPDYYPLAGSQPPGKTKSHYKTGRPSRISFQRIDHSQPSGRKCRGA
jgi:hypothetical protein